MVLRDETRYLNFTEVNNLLEAAGADTLHRPAFDDLCFRFSDLPQRGLSVDAIRRLHSSRRLSRSRDGSPTESRHSAASITSAELSDGIPTPEITENVPGTPPPRQRPLYNQPVRKQSSVQFESADDNSSDGDVLEMNSQDPPPLSSAIRLDTPIPDTADSVVFASPPLLGHHRFRVTRARAIVSRLRKEKWKETDQSTEEILRMRLEPAPAYMLGGASLERLWCSFRGLPSGTVLPTTWTPPAEMMAQESELQRFASMFGWSALLADACAGTDPLARALQVASFLLAAFHETSDFAVLPHQPHPGEVYRCGYECLRAVNRRLNPHPIFKIAVYPRKMSGLSAPFSVRCRTLQTCALTQRYVLGALRTVTKKPT